MGNDYGLALSGGGARGAAHVGVLMALEEEGLLPDRIAGTSAGSIVAGLFASGMTVEQLKEAVLWLGKYGNRYLDPDVAGALTLLPDLIIRRRIRLPGILKGNRLMEFFGDLTDQMRLRDVPLGLLIPAVDLNSGDTIVFTNLFENHALPGTAAAQEHVRWEQDGILCEIMMASSSVPAVFQPRRMGDYRMVDGGVTNNLPVDLLIAAGTGRVIAVDLGATYEPPGNDSIVETASHSFSIMGRELKDCRSSGEQLLLKPPLPAGAGLLDFCCMEECMNQGYTYTRMMMPRIRRAVRETGQSSGSRRIRSL